MDPYVYVEIHGIPVDCTERRTRTVTQNGDNPIFDESFEFQINLPELAMVRFMVLDDDYIGDEFIGQCHWKVTGNVQNTHSYISLNFLPQGSIPSLWNAFSQAIGTYRFSL